MTNASPSVNPYASRTRISASRSVAKNQGFALRLVLHSQCHDPRTFELKDVLCLCWHYRFGPEDLDDLKRRHDMEISTSGVWRTSSAPT
jgi:hypothetical protein